MTSALKQRILSTAIRPQVYVVLMLGRVRLKLSGIVRRARQSIYPFQYELERMDENGFSSTAGPSLSYGKGNSIQDKAPWFIQARRRRD